MVADDDLGARLTDLEIRYSHQTELVDQLSEVIRGQQAQIDQLTRTLEMLRTQIEAGDADIPHEKPPHY